MCVCTYIIICAFCVNVLVLFTYFFVCFFELFVSNLVCVLWECCVCQFIYLMDAYFVFVCVSVWCVVFFCFCFYLVFKQVKSLLRSVCQTVVVPRHEKATAQAKKNKIITKSTTKIGHWQGVNLCCFSVLLVIPVKKIYNPKNSKKSSCIFLIMIRVH